MEKIDMTHCVLKGIITACLREKCTHWNNAQERCVRGDPAVLEKKLQETKERLPVVSSKESG